MSIDEMRDGEGRDDEPLVRLGSKSAHLVSLLTENCQGLFVPNSLKIC